MAEQILILPGWGHQENSKKPPSLGMSVGPFLAGFILPENDNPLQPVSSVDLISV